MAGDGVGCLAMGQLIQKQLGKRGKPATNSRARWKALRKLSEGVAPVCSEFIHLRSSPASPEVLGVGSFRKDQRLRRFRLLAQE